MIQGSEILIILLVALVVLGPQKLPDLARKLGGWSVELRRAARDFRVGLEAEVADLKDFEREVRKPLDEVRDELRSTGRAVDDSSDLRRLGWVGPEPASGPTSSDALADLEGIEGGAEAEPPKPAPDEPGDGTST